MLTVAQARALVTTSLSDTDLADVILREEAWLSRRIGPLTGERVELFLPLDGDEVLRLLRPTDAVAVEDDGGAVSVDLRGWSDVVRASGSWSGDTTATYTPNDAGEVRRSLVTLVRLTVHESAYAAQSASGYSATSSEQDRRTMRYTAWRTLLRPTQPTTMRLRSAIPSGGKTLASVG